MQHLVCFGTGMDGKAFLSAFRGKIFIEYFLDNYREGKWENYDVYKPTKDRCLGKYIVVTTTEYFFIIKRQLESYGLIEKIHFISVLDYFAMNSEILCGNLTGGVLENSFMRKKKVINYQLYCGSDFPEKEKLAAEVYENAVILPIRKYPEDGNKPFYGRGGVVDHLGEYVELSKMEGYVEGKYEFHAAIYSNKKVVYCGGLIVQWGHFLTEVIARLWYFLENDDSVDSYVFGIKMGTEKACLSGNYGEFFRLLGMEDKVELISEPIQYREVIVPQPSYWKSNYYSRQYKNIFSVVIREALHESRGSSDYEKVYLSRMNWGRMEYGQDMLADFFERNGFKTVYPEDMPLTKLIFILQKADIVAVPSGSAHHNILFGKDETRVVVIEKTAIHNQHQTDINRIKRLKVSQIDANLVFYPVGIGRGPFLYYWNDLLNRFAQDNNWKLPDLKFHSKTYIKENIEKYLAMWKKSSLQSNWNELFEEAYKESMENISEEHLCLNYLISSKGFFN